ncbi:biotin/lipoyl-binding protein [Nocardioides dubius]|uniref:Efflux RND transporter periplasmic adaptor subunit n=1 Tax=Nocardioides dubius TaxID=317019 RepID=A0ABN1TLH8_9ACTN
MQALLGRLAAVRRRWWIIIVVALLVAGFGVWRWMPDDEAQQQASTATASMSTMRTTVGGEGTLVARRQTDVAFSSSGEVTAVKVEAGDTVRKGQVLARIDTEALEAERSAAIARVESARAALVESVAAGSDSTRITADQASLSAARTALEAARDAVTDATLRAPFAGTVQSVGVEVGDQVGSGGSGASTQQGLGTSAAASTTSSSTSSVISVVSTGRYDVELTVSASDVEQLEVGQQSEITVTGASDTVFGTVKSVAKIASTDSSGAAAFPVVVQVTGAPEGLHIGASAQATVIVEELGDVLTVPTNAMRSDDDGSYVMLVGADGTERRTVTTGTAYGMQTEITEGLSEGDTVELATQQRSGGGGRGGQGQMPEGFSPPEGFEPPAGFTPGSGFPGGAQ